MSVRHPGVRDSFYAFAEALSVDSQVFLLPMVGALADYGRRKREWLAGTAFVGSAATLAMFS